LIDDLAPDIYVIQTSPGGGLLSASTNMYPKDGKTHCAGYPSINNDSTLRNVMLEFSRFIWLEGYGEI
jgi:hypothetical protein